MYYLNAPVTQASELQFPNPVIDIVRMTGLLKSAGPFFSAPQHLMQKMWMFFQLEDGAIEDVSETNATVVLRHHESFSALASSSLRNEGYPQRVFCSTSTWPTVLATALRNTQMMYFFYFPPRRMACVWCPFVEARA